MKPSAATDRNADDASVGLAIRDVPSHLRIWLTAGAVLWLDLWSKQWVFANLPPDKSHPLIPGFLDLHRSLNDGAVFGSLTGYVGLFIAASVFALGFVTYLFACSSRTQRALHVALGLILAGAFGNLYDRAVSKADILSYTTPSGREVTAIGRILDEPPGSISEKEKFVWIGSWPDGEKPRRFDRSQVTVKRQGVVRDFLKFTSKFPTWMPWFGKRANRDIWPWVFNVADSALVCGVGALLFSSWLGRGIQESA